MFRSSTGSGRLRRAALLLRWSGRDLRARWVQVAAIAMVIALGTGAYAGLSSVTRWRRLSSDAAYERLAMHDVRVHAAQAASLPEGTLAGAIRRVAGGDVAGVEERLLADVQVDASTADQVILVPGMLYGAGGAGGPRIDRRWIAEGRDLDYGGPEDRDVLIERNFGKHYGLPPEGVIRLSGGVEVGYAGQALTPELFLVTTERGGLLSEANFAAVFASLATAQALVGRPGQVNDAVVVLGPGADPETVAARLEEGLSAELGGVGTTVTTRAEDPSFRLNDRDIEGDQQVYDIIAVLIFMGAVVAAFNLTARIVEAQRREIGVAMVLGVPPARIAVRPLLVGAEIALLGVLFGIAVGWGIGRGMAAALSALMPLPAWNTSFQWGIFAAVGALGFLLPFAASAWPVWRAVRVAPIEAIRAGYRSARGWGLAPRLKWLRLPGDTFVQIPLRNVIRTPRRTLLTGLGIASAVSILIAFVGLIDSFIATVDRADRESLRVAPDRVEVDLASFLAIEGPEVTALRASGVVRRLEPGLRLDALLSNGRHEVGARVELLSFDEGIWTPSLSHPPGPGEVPGIYLSELAAKDLGVRRGDTVTLRHPVLEAGGTVRLEDTSLLVLGTHPHPFRFLAYMDRAYAGLFGAEGLTNLLIVEPSPGTALDDVKRDLFGRPGVVSVVGVGEVTDSIRDTIGEFLGVFRVIEGAVLVLALLIAFNSASINMDERVREHATMFAFGVPIRVVIRMAIIENFVLGIFSTLLGLAGGWFVLELIISIRIPETLPDIYIPPRVSGTTFAIATVLGVIAVALAPLLTWRKLSRTNIPGALKVME